MRSILFVIAALLLSCSLEAQVGLRFNVNLDSQPAWGPTGYDHVEYYYFPSIEAYYNVPQQKFIYKQGRRWAVSSRLPSRYDGFDFFHSYKVVVNDPKPYRNHGMYRDRYASYKDRRDQESIRDSRDSKYFVNRDHPEHDSWVRPQRNDNEDRGSDRYAYDRNSRDRKDAREDERVTRMNDKGETNINDQPAWAPTGYDHAEYYYIPDINSYYSVADHQYIYWAGSDWRRSESLPPSYSNFDPYRSYKVVINESNPFENNDSHRSKYASFKGAKEQPMIRDSRDSRYFSNKDHPEHDSWVRQQRSGDNGRTDGRNDNDRDPRDNQGGRQDDRGASANSGTGANINDQPVWGPTGYDRADYYYIPDINSYYSVADHQYIYWEGSDWKHAEALPSSYGNFDPYRSYKVVINESNPVQNNNAHRAKYGSFKGTTDQPVIRDSHDAKYFANKDHPEHKNWLRGQQR